MSDKVIDIVIDLETLGTVPGSVILSIGACVAQDIEEPDKQFYATISRSSCEDVGLVVCKETIDWWNKQDIVARQEAFSALHTLKDTLVYFSTYLGEFPKKRVWGNGTAFDLGILAAAYKACGMKVPWHYREEMCYRTVKSLYPKILVPTLPNTPHKAIDDACSEAKHLALILNYIEAGEHAWPI